MPPQTLTQQEILQLMREIMAPQFDALKAQIADLKETISANADAHRLENERRRVDVHDLYQKDRDATTRHNELVARVVALEGWRDGHMDAHTSSTDGQKFTAKQRLVAVGISVPAVLWVLEKALDIVNHLGGK